MLESLLQPYESSSEALDDSIYICYFLQALYWSLGAGLTEPARVIFDSQVKYLASMTSVDEGPGGTAKLGMRKILFNILI
jgi:dynein heavy chain